MKISTVFLCLLMLAAGFGDGFPWGMVMQFNKLSVPVMNMVGE